MMGLDHPHIIRVLDFGLQGPVPFLVMSYALIMGVLLVVGSATVGLATLLPRLFQMSGFNTTEARGTLVSAFLSDAEQRDYEQAYRHLSSSLLLVMTATDFTRLVQADDRCYGPITYYEAVAHSEKVQHGE